jgi:hypothetical protein
MKFKQHGAAEARRAHNPEDARSKLAVATFLLLFAFWVVPIHVHSMVWISIRRPSR